MLKLRSDATNYTHLSCFSAILQTNVFEWFFHFFSCSSNSWQVIYWELIHLSNIKPLSVCRKIIPVPFETPLLGTNVVALSVNMLNRQASRNFACISNRPQVWRLRPSGLGFMQSWDWVSGVNISDAAAPTVLSVKANAKQLVSAYLCFFPTFSDSAGFTHLMLCWENSALVFASPQNILAG